MQPGTPSATLDDMTRPRHRAVARQPAPHIAGKERDMRYIRTARLCHSRRPGNRGRLARILGPELPAGTSGTRHAGYVLHRKRPRHPAPYPHQLHSGTHHGDAETAYPGSMPRQVFRNEAISYRAHCIFHQIEGLYIDEGVSFADMKQSLLTSYRSSSARRRKYV